MDILNVSDQIEQKIKELDQFIALLANLAILKAENMANYDKELAKVIISLKNGIKYELDGIIIDSPQTTITEKIAKGICWKELLEKDKTETRYKNTVETIDIIKAQLNGYQTIYRHLSHI